MNNTNYNKTFHLEELHNFIYKSKSTNENFVKIIVTLIQEIPRICVKEINHTTSIFGTSLLHHACMNDSPIAVAILLQHKEINVNLPNNQGTFCWICRILFFIF